jgi:hypothetical protein
MAGRWPVRLRNFQVDRAGEALRGWARELLAAEIAVVIAFRGLFLEPFRLEGR